MSATADARVAVVIACYNDGALLTEAVTSVFAQEPCELVIVNDGSTDAGTLRTLKELERSGVRVLHQENCGFCAARMAGVAATRARYVHPLDADDRFPLGALTALADALDSQPGAQAAWGDMQTFGAFECRLPSAPQLDPWRITYFDELPGTSMLRREALIETGGWDMGSGYADWDLWMKVAERGWRGVYVQRATLLYRQHEEPRMWAEAYAAHAELRQLMRFRHRKLFTARSRNWARSPSPWTIKVLWPVVGVLPGVPELRKHQLYAMVRHIFQRDMSSDCFRGPLSRARELVTHARLHHRQ